MTGEEIYADFKILAEENKGQLEKEIVEEDKEVE